MKTIKVLSMILITVIYFSCTKNDAESLNKTVLIKLLPTIEVSQDEYTRLKNTSTENVLLYAVQIYEEGAPYYYGLFNDVSKMEIALTTNKKYTFKVAAFQKGSGTGLKTLTQDGITFYYMPDTLALLNKFVQGDRLNKISSISNAKLLNNTNSEFPEIDAFYQETEITATKEMSTMDLILKRTGFGLGITVDGLNSGTIEVYFAGDTIQFSPSKNNYFTIRSFKGGESGLKDVAQMDTFSVNTVFVLKWIGNNGSIVTANKIVKIKRNFQLPLNITINSTNTGIEIENWQNVLEQNTNTPVSTLSGWKDQYDKTEIVDGTLATAQYKNPYWLTFDQNKDLYLLEEFEGLRFIDLHNKTVTTKFRMGNGMIRPRTLAFSLTWDTLYVTNDAWDETSNSTVILTKQTNYTKWNTLINSRTCVGSDVHPQTGDYFYTEYYRGFLYKWNNNTRTSETMYRADDVDWEFNVQFAPSGDFAYLVCMNRHYIMKSMYNRETRKLEAPSVVCGLRATAGWQDGVGTAARFNNPHQGAFDENDNFYVCDVNNHCIRKITPYGVVSTFAGRPQNPGYLNGALREAQFKNPRGIVYDKETRTFYIADEGNSRIRKIVMN